MNAGKTLGFGAKAGIFLLAFVVVILFNAYVSPEISKNFLFWFRTGDYFSLFVVLAETLVVGVILRHLLVWTFKMQFERKMKA